MNNGTTIMNTETTIHPRLQHVARDPEVLLDLVEAAQPEEHVAHDQKRPALADDLERSGDRARL